MNRLINKEGGSGPEATTFWELSSNGNICRLYTY